MEKIISDIIFVGTGITVTLKLLFGGLLLGITLGTLISVLRYNNICVALINTITSIVRGTPMILQLSFIYCMIPNVVGVKLSIVVTGIIAFGLNSSAYVAEIFRSGIESLPKGQFEAAQTLGISKFHMWKDIILPQVMINILPSIINEVITLLKETALIATIGGMDIMRTSQMIAAEQFTYFMPLCIAGMYYYNMVLFIEYIGKKIEQRKAYAKNS